MKRKSIFDIPPEFLFLILALPFGILFAFITPPLAGSDEYFHYQRIATIAYGHWLNEDAAVPSGIATFLKKTAELNAGGLLVPYYAEQFSTVAAIPLGNDMDGKLEANFCTIHNAANYIPQILAFKVGAYFNASPLMLLYITRLAALLASVWITYHAIRVIPSWKYTMAALALLPPLVFYRICLSTDAMADAFGIYFIACVMREIARNDIIKRASLIRMVAFGFLLGLCKLPYVCVTLLVVAIPAKRFKTQKKRWLCCAMTMIPGALAGLLWMEMSRRGIFVGLRYETWGGSAYPDGQMAYITHDPLGFMGVLAQTLFSFGFYADAVLEAFGHFGTMNQLPLFYGIMLPLFLLVLVMDGTGIKAHYPLRAKIWVLPVLAGFLLLSLTALYVHWTGLQAPAVKGFQGRYLYPLIPLFLMIVPFQGRPRSAATSAITAGIFGFTGLMLSLPLLLAHWK